MNMTNLYTPILIAVLSWSGVATHAQDNYALRLSDLKVEHLRNPIQLNIGQPRLSWKVQAKDPNARDIHQQTYRILVASSSELLANNKADLWDSGQVTSSKSVLIAYQGKKLRSRQACFWKVRITDSQGNSSDWSDVARWEMALLEPKNWSGSQWIGLQRDTRDHEFSSRKHHALNEHLDSQPSPLLRKQVLIRQQVRRARAYVSGIGYSEFYINGKKIGDHVLDPGQTNYHKHTLYVVHDITGALEPGENALGLWLGNGFYGQNLGFNKKFGYGKPKVRAKLFVEYADGTSEEFGTDTT